MKNYNYRILNTSIMDKTKINSLSDLKKYVLSIHGNCKIEYWSENGKFSGEININ